MSIVFFVLLIILSVYVTKLTSKGSKSPILLNPKIKGLQEDDYAIKLIVLWVNLWFGLSRYSLNNFFDLWTCDGNSNTRVTTLIVWLCNIAFKPRDDSDLRKSNFLLIFISWLFYARFQVKKIKFWFRLKSSVFIRIPVMRQSLRENEKKILILI